MSLYTTQDPEYMAKSRFISASSYYAAEEAREEWDEMVATNARLIDQLNEAEEAKEILNDANLYLHSELEILQADNERLLVKCAKLEEYSAEQFNRAICLQQDLDMMDKCQDNEDYLDKDCWEAY